MNKERNLLFAGIFGLITFSFLAFVVINYQLGWFGVMVIVGATALFLLIASILEMYVRVKEMETAVVFSRLTNKFSRFLPEGQHLINPTEYIFDTITTQPFSLSGYCGNVQTVDGITIEVEWDCTVAVDPTVIPEEFKAFIARALPKGKEKMVRKYGNQCIRYLLNQLSARSLMDSGVRPSLDRKLRDLIVQRVHQYGLQPFRVMITGISFPQPIQQANNEAYKREVTLMSKAREMAQFANVIYGLPESDRLWLTRLLQTYMMGEHGVNLVMPYPAHYPSSQPGPQPSVSDPTGNFPFPPGPDNDIPNGVYGEMPRH